MKNTTKAQATKQAKANENKQNVLISPEVLTSIYEDMIIATTKRDLVDTMNKFGFRTNTTPTTTPNKNDLYFQFFDKSRMLITSKSLKVYTNEDHASALTELDESFVFDGVNDGSYRIKRATVARSLENFATIFTYFLNNGCIDKLPQVVEQ